MSWVGCHALAAAASLAPWLGVAGLGLGLVVGGLGVRSHFEGS